MYLLLITILLVPTKNIYIYSSVTAFAIFLYGLWNWQSTEIRQQLRNNYLLSLFSVVTFLFFSAWLRSLTASPNIRDFIEVGRFLLPISIIAFSFLWRSSSQIFYHSLTLFSFANLALSILQAINVTINIKSLKLVTLQVSQLFINEVHYNSAYLLAKRIPGISPGPGQQGVICCITSLYFLSQWAFSSDVKTKLRSLTLFFANFALVILAQSQTAFVAMGLMTLLIFLIRIIARMPRMKLGLKGIAAILGAVTMFYSLARYYGLAYLETLFTHGTSRSSFQRRIEKWNDILDRCFDSPEWTFVGHGKDYFGALSSAMDSEFLYFYAVYGILLFLLLIAGYILLISESIHQMLTRNYFGSAVLASIAGSGIIFSISSSFLLDPKVCLIAILCVIFATNSGLATLRHKDSVLQTSLR